jgi:2-polyprenyl-3-methyl-5-hydroxy-6-metoxy-1,4-benzoquinol methylase
MQEPLLAEARKRAREAGVGERCQFVTASNEKCDVVISLDSFEHFTDPLSVLEIMRGLLKPEGYVWTSFGPTWCHPYGGHGFSPFPWAPDL